MTRVFKLDKVATTDIPVWGQKADDPTNTEVVGPTQELELSAVIDPRQVGSYDYGTIKLTLGTRESLGKQWTPGKRYKVTIEAVE